MPILLMVLYVAIHETQMMKLIGHSCNQIGRYKVLKTQIIDEIAPIRNGHLPCQPKCFCEWIFLLKDFRDLIPESRSFWTIWIETFHNQKYFYCIISFVSYTVRNTQTLTFHEVQNRARAIRRYKRLYICGWTVHSTPYCCCFCRCRANDQRMKFYWITSCPLR